MAYRKVHESFWTDPDIEDLTPEQKYFYLYLLTNPRCNQIGLFEFSVKRAVYETGYNHETVQKLLEFFEGIGKIRLSRKTKEIVICKFYYHNKSNSPKVLAHVDELLSKVKDTVLIQYIYSMHTASQEEEEEEKEEQEEKTQEEDSATLDILAVWNEVNECNLRLTPSKRKDVERRLRTFSKDEIIEAIRKRRNSEAMQRNAGQYLASWESFFRSDDRVEKYLNLKEAPETKKTNIFERPF